MSRLSQLLPKSSPFATAHVAARAGRIGEKMGRLPSRSRARSSVEGSVIEPVYLWLDFTLINYR